MKKSLSSFTILCIFVCLSIVGIGLIPSLNVQLKPNRSSQSVLVNFNWSNTSAKVIEQEVTSKLEGLFNALKGVQEISSLSKKGSGIIQLILKEDTNRDLFRFEVLNVIRQNYQSFPEDVSYPTLSKNTFEENESPVLSYTIQANESANTIKRYVESYITPKLSEVDGIRQISLYGATPFEWVITYETDRLSQHELSVDDVAGAVTSFLKKQELGKGISANETGDKEVPLKLVCKSSTVIDWNKIPIKKLGDRVLFLEDVAQVAFQKGTVNEYYRVNGLNTLNLVVYADANTNIIKLSQDMTQKIVQVQKSLRSGYFIKKTSDSSDYLVKELTKIQKRALFSMLILLLLSILIYRHYKYLFVLFASIVITLIVAVIFYVLFDVQIQLYSLAGITISFGIIIDNCIIMMDHVLLKKNRKAFLAILAATFTTIGAVLIIFFLEKEQQLNLLDFAIVIGINIGVSLVVSFYFVPALIDQLHLTKHQKKRSFKRRKRILFFSKSYQRLLLLLKKPWLKWSFVLILVFGFGIPLHLFPKEIEHPNDLGEIYNATLGSNWFQNQRSTLEPIVGGTFRLFTQDVFENSYYAEPEETSINITGRMPEGCTVQQLNDAITKMEAYLSTFDEISLFETQITSYRNGQINVYFKDDLPSESFPFTLKNQIETKALSLGGLDWFVTGVGEGFSNAVGSSGLGERIILEGYNYDQLYAFAEELKASIFENSKNRVEKAQISGEKWGSSALAEFYLEFNPELVELSKLKTTKIYNQLKNRLHSENATAVVQNNELQEVKIVSDTYLNFNIWDLKNTPIQIDSSQYKLSELAFIEKRKTGNTIRKTNQKYSLTLAYNFKGPDRMADRFNKLWSSQFHEQLSIGYRAYSPNQKDRWDREDKTQYYYLFLIIGIIFFVCSILLDSLRQPIAIILMIPISFVGVFLTFYAFEINFDQGGYASFILLAGISVNSALYILNDFNNLKKDRPNLSLSTQYQKAFLSKITPVLITILTTIFGLIPFIWDGQQEVFWFSFAAGSIGGLVFSLIGIFLYLPLFMKLQMRRIH